VSVYLLLLGLIIVACAAVTVYATINWKGDRYLCDDCMFNSPDSCHKIERPQAVTCFAYRKNVPVVDVAMKRRGE
jgi:hypothetical protein